MSKDIYLLEKQLLNSKSGRAFHTVGRSFNKEHNRTMSQFSSERSKPWNIYTSSDPTPSETGVIDHETPWKSFGTSMNAIAFGFVATAILISMFLIMAIFEHLFRPNPSFSLPQEMINRSLESGPVDKLGNPRTVTTTSYVSDRFFSSDAWTALSYLHCSTSSSSMPKGRDLLAFP
ncbi:hypothetical protein GH714_023101 [Hevea brasiliensis]|uniref:Uncharacterized protein n=1 Tax=Hevea brasiliensis TaxID=3981 RepID=A0A6A6N5D5_HEVBR|nr:hypothetical protein GH714_023101 [Hevea brasiliensis]